MQESDRGSDEEFDAGVAVADLAMGSTRHVVGRSAATRSDRRPGAKNTRPSVPDFTCTE